MGKVKVAIIGGAGRIGTYLVRRLASENTYVPVPIIRDKMAERFLGDDRKLARIGSIIDSDSASRLIGDCEVVINLAFSGSTPSAIHNNIELIKAITTLRTVNVIVNVSTISVYGEPFTTHHMNFEKPEPNSQYGESKLTMEKIVSGALNKTSSRYFLIRLGAVYGPSQTVSMMVYGNVMSPSFKLPFDGDMSSNAVSVDRFVEGVVSILNDPPQNGVYNCVEEPQKTWREIYDLHTCAWKLPRVGSMSYESSYLLRKKVRIASGFESLPIQRKLKHAARYLIHNPFINNQVSKEIYLKYRRHIPININKRIASSFGKTSSGVINERIAESTLDTPEIPSLLFSDPVPGRNLLYDSSLSALNKDISADLWEWFRDQTEFRWDTSSLKT